MTKHPILPFLALALLLVSTRAHAYDDDGYESSRRHEWSDHREGLVWELSGGAFGGSNTVGRAHGTFVGETFSLGFHTVSDFEEKSLSGERTPGASWCAPVGCFLFGAAFIPKSAFVGNEVGLDIRMRFTHATSDNAVDARSGSFAIGIRPTFRVARESRVRTASFFGALVPEMGLVLSKSRSPAVYLEWTPYPLGVRISRHMGFEWDTFRIGPILPLDGTRAGVSLSSAVSLVLL